MHDNKVFKDLKLKNVFLLSQYKTLCNIKKSIPYINAFKYEQSIINALYFSTMSVKVVNNGTQRTNYFILNFERKSAYCKTEVYDAFHFASMFGTNLS